MGLLDHLKRTTIPTPKDIKSIPTKLKEETEKRDINTIYIRKFTRDFKKARKPVLGTIDSSGVVPIVRFNVPFKGAVLLLQDYIYEDEQTGQRTLDIVDGYAYGLDKGSDLFQDLKYQYYNDKARGLLGEEEIKRYEQSGIGYYIPVLLKDIPRPVVKITVDEKLPQTDPAKYAEITQSYLTNYADSVFLQRMEKPNNSGVFMGMIFGAALISPFVMVLTLFLVG